MGDTCLWYYKHYKRAFYNEIQCIYLSNKSEIFFLVMISDVCVEIFLQIVDELKVIKVNPDLVKYLEVNRSIREQWSPDRHYLDDGNCLQYKSKVKRSSSLSRPVSRWSNQSLIEEQTPAVSGNDATQF